MSDVRFKSREQIRGCTHARGCTHTRGCTHAPSLLSSLAALAGRPPPPPSPGDLVSVVTVLIFIPKARDGIQIAQFRPAFFFFSSKKDPIEILPDHKLKEPRPQNKMNGPQKPCFCRAELRTRLDPHTLPPRPTAKGASATFPNPCERRPSSTHAEGTRVQTGCYTASGLDLGVSSFLNSGLSWEIRVILQR